MSRTQRWWTKPKYKWLVEKFNSHFNSWKQINPFYNYEKLYKWQRQKIHRIFRHNNKIRIQKGWETVKEPQQHGWTKGAKQL